MRVPLLILLILFSVPVFASYTKIANNGSDLPDSALLGSAPTDWACTRDNSSGLIWEVKTTDGGLRSMDKTYTQYDDATQAQKPDGSKPSQAEIEAASNSIGLVNAVRASRLCGSGEWRMPSVKELSGLVQASIIPSINPTFFPNTPVQGYWSGSFDIDAPDAAWLVSFSYGYSYRYKRSDMYSIRLVFDRQSVPGNGTVVEFYNANLDHYFITADASEATQIDNGSAGGWTRTGNTFPSGGSTPVCRFYGSQIPGPNSHFYTVSTAECDDLKAQQASTPETQKRWNFESFDFNSTPPVSGVCPSGSGMTPVYRAYNNGYARGVDSNHRITSNLAGIQQVVAQGWSNEGIVMCAPPAPAQPAPDSVAYQGAFPSSTPSGLTGATLTLGGQSREVLIYRPGNSAGLPLLIFFSGTGATFDYNIADEIGRDGLRAFADREGVIVAIPIPRRMQRGDWDNHWSDTPYWETATTEAVASPVSADPEVNPDLLLTRAIIKEAQTRYAADAARVYLNGFSNGAFFSYFAAATLGDRIAAFAETGGGLVLSHTTAGQPTPCVSVPYAGSSDEVRSCPAAGWNPGLCVQADAVARPIAPAQVQRVPPAFLEANDNDDSVSFAHTCNLSASLPANTPQQTRIRHSGLGHALNEDYLINSWKFMKEYRLW